MKSHVEVDQKIQSLLTQKPQKDPYRRFTILAYQLADVGRCMRYAEIYPDDRKEYLSYLRTAMSDLVIQTMVIAELYNFEFTELVELGVKRLDEFRKKGRYVEETR